MSRREIVAYAITHAPRGVQGGPYTGNGSTAHQVPTMALASAVEVLRALVAAHDAYVDGAALAPGSLDTLIVRARSVLAASGPDPMPVVRAAMRFAEHCTPALAGAAWFEATCEFIDAVDAYQKAGGTP